MHLIRVLFCLVLLLAVAADSHFEDDSGSTAKPVEKKEYLGVYNPQYVFEMYRAGVRRVTRNAKTVNCKARIEHEYMKQMISIAEERAFPWEDVFFHSQCKGAMEDNHPLMTVGTNKPPKRPDMPEPMPANMTYKDPAEISILYVMLIHNHADFAKRLMHALDEPQHHFYIHVDRKAPEVQDAMDAFAAEGRMGANVHVMQEHRENGAWGGFSLVNATLNTMRAAFDRNVTFDYLIDISGTTYPLVDNTAIRTALAKNRGHTYMQVHDKPSRPQADMWLNFVECDGKLHRISRLSHPRGIAMFVGSQWFAIPWHVAHWYLNDDLPQDYVQYAKHVVVSDEHYFATMLKNSPYCHEVIRKNHVFVLFDKWENEKNKNILVRDTRKCLHPNPEHCGRSPTTLTTEYRRLLQASQHLFARKFDPSNSDSLAMLEEIDLWRQDPTHRAASSSQRFMVRHRRPDEAAAAGLDLQQDDDAERLAALAKNDTCLELSNRAGRMMRIVPCAAERREQWFTFGHCSGPQKLLNQINLADQQCGFFGTGLGSDGIKSAVPSTGGETLADDASLTCQLMGSREAANSESDSENFSSRTSTHTDGKCADISGENPNTGAHLISWECTGNWNQQFHYGDDCTLRAVQPDVIANVRSLPTNVTRCVASQGGGGVEVLTQNCPVAVLAISNDGNGTDSAAASVLSPPPPVLAQQWQVMPADGSLWKLYDHPSAASKKAPDTTANATEAAMKEESKKDEKEEPFIIDEEL